MKNLLFLFALIPFTLSAQQGNKNFIDQNYIEVTGKAEMEIAPDMIYLRIVIDEKDEKNRVSIDQKEKQMISALKKIGVDVEEDLLIKDMSSQFRRYLLSKDDISLSKEYQLLVHDGKMAGEVFLKLEEIEISNIKIQKLDHSKIEDFRRQVKVDAIKAAKSKAQDLAGAVDQEIGKALFIQELNNISRYGEMNKMANSVSFYANSKVNDTILDFEKIILEYSILCRFELK